MMVKIFTTVVCLISISRVAYSRSFSFYDLQPAKARANVALQQSKPLHGSPIFHNCSTSSDKFQLTNVLVAGCSAPPCILKKGTNASVEIDFIAYEVTSVVTAKVYGQIAGVKVPFPLTQDDGCKCGITCPTKMGASYTYKYALPISSEYPSMTLAVFWYLDDSEKGEALCTTVEVKIE